jgi:riboflavin synthase
MSDIKNEKDKKLAKVKNLIHDFCKDYLNPELEGYCFKLYSTLGRKRKINILRSASEQWAASIIYVIARLNFLFDQENEYHITADDLCGYFDTKKSTTGNKATQIEKLCNLSMGAEGYCSAEISDMFIYYETESGLIIPKYMLDKRITEVQRANEEDELEIRRRMETEESIHEKRQKEKQEHLSALRKKAKRRDENENQLGLFDK